MVESHEYTVAPSIVLIDPRQERRLLMAQYIAIAWPHAEVVEWEASLDSLVADPLFECSALLCWVDADQVDMKHAVHRALGDPRCPPLIVACDDVTRSQTLLQVEHVHYLDWQQADRNKVAHVIRNAIEDREQWLRNSAKTVPLAATKKTAAVSPPSYSGREALVPIRGYRAINKLGDGGMSRVFAAERLSDGQKLVLKVFDAGPAQDQERLSLFLKEYAILAQIDSPYVVRIIDHGVTDQYAFIAMEYLEGGDLRDRVQAGLTTPGKLRILTDILRALEVIHAAGVTHRDLKPQNIMFRRAGGLVLVDFGISNVSSALTASSFDLVGTPGYVSPEQVLGQRTDARSDLYSLGAIFFEMLTGRHIFSAVTVTDLLRKHVNDSPPQLPVEFAQFQDLSNRLLAKLPTERFQSARQALRFLNQHWPANAASDELTATPK